ncbi:MAG: hypothetical protein HKN57_12880 [Xanthomonadales bacterium]|nr:hypothetical protein [Gammaproteobacteria bacterium]MBT8054629.1 hypothetical protein [Gammaproteobacteria bacterium]NND58131.1 hypothetical protein [Xanthomonadales bacterium]NNK50404.1 hypothetical protein [Xanthomonadales bacterium]
MVLKEIVNTGQVSGRGFRRWFSDPKVDLFVWEDADANIAGFQLCYGKGSDEHAFTWQKSKGYTHHKIDDGEDVVIGHKSSPILVPDGQFDPSALSQYFISKSKKLDSNITRFICEKLTEYEKEKAG